MPALLRIIDGPQAGASCELRPGQRAVLGRGEASDFHILDSWASRDHCAVTCKPEGIILEDLGSKNGTYVSGQRADRARLPDGSLIQIGTTTIQVLSRPALGTGAVPGVVPSRRGLRTGLLVGAAGLLLVGLVYGGLQIFSGSRRQPEGGTAAARVDQPRKIRRGSGGPTVTITSEPPGATVFIDDEFRGTTPVHGVETAAGEHALRVQKAGFQVYRRTLAVERRGTAPVHIVLRLAERGALAVQSKPTSASVFLDNEYRGKTPLRLDDLEPQTYSLRLEKANFAEWRQRVSVESNKTLTIKATLGHREISYYRAELKKDPNNVSYHTELAHLYLLEKKVDECIRHLTTAFEITAAGRDSTQPEPYTRRLVWLVQKIHKNDHFYYGDAAFVGKVQDRMDAMFDGLERKHPGSTVIQQMVRKLRRPRGARLRVAPVRLERAEARPRAPGRVVRIVALLQQAGDTRRAKALLQKALDAAPDDYRVYLDLGRIHLQGKRRGNRRAREKAIEAFNAALQRCQDKKAQAEIRRLLGEATR